MIKGRLGIKIGFEEFELGPGDSIAFDAQMPHRLWTVGREPAEALWVVLNRHGDNRRTVHVNRNWRHQTRRCARQTSSGLVGTPNAARESTNRIVRSSHGFAHQTRSGGSQAATW